MSGLTQRYISKELVHFVGRGMSDEKQFDLLAKIINGKYITHPPHSPNISGNLSININATISDNEMYSPEITCFADIPLQELSLHMVKYSSIGLSFSKDFIAKAGGVPVHYLAKDAVVKRMKNLSNEEMMNINRNENMLEQLYENVPKGRYFDEMIKEYHELFSVFNDLAQQANSKPGVPEFSERIRKLRQFFDFHIISYFKFFDHTKSDEDPDNYYFEREWRVVGNVKFSLTDIKTVFLPSKFSHSFRELFPIYAGQVVFTD